VAENAGALADVSLRYKDLIYLKNSHDQKQLNLDEQTNKTGPLQLNVIKNVLAQHFSKTIRQTSSLLQWKRYDDAEAHLSNLLSLYQSIQYQFTNWKTDKEINNDIKLLQKYLHLLKSASHKKHQQISFIVNSLQYISWRKFISNPI
jgi:hypothetical protein